MTLWKLIFAGLVWVSSAQQNSLLPRAFQFQGASNRFITPNGDGKNDAAYFNFSNPQFSSITGRIFDLDGKRVASMAAGTPSAEQLVWNGKSDEGKIVSAGVYVYVIEAERSVVRGLVVVIR
ncbi:MAG TPA: hypothetical protein DEB40_03910 [Elusimicrobia bacterium]|nr:hypothetical protein [Elusimicrobiota bacterium]HBT60872.1 hypothetical protein [Elusimicrobiota bacterium]